MQHDTDTQPLLQMNVTTDMAAESLRTPIVTDVTLATTNIDELSGNALHSALTRLLHRTNELDRVLIRGWTDERKRDEYTRRLAELR